MPDTKAPLSFLLEHNKYIYPHKLVATYPHIAKRMDELWNNSEAISDYFMELLIPARSDRAGFAHDIALEIMSLSMAYDKIGQIKPANDIVNAPLDPTYDLWQFEDAINEFERLGVKPTVAKFASAAESGDIRMCVLFLSAKFDVDTRDSKEWTILMTAAFSGNVPLAEVLIKLGADVRASDQGGYTALHWAAFNGHTEMVELLINKGMPPNIVSQAGITPILQAAARGFDQTVAVLLKNRADPNITANDGSSPLLKAFFNAHIKIIDLLLASGARLDVNPANASTLMKIAKRTQDPELHKRISIAMESMAS
jgi:ankyrin repeat protein